MYEERLQIGELIKLSRWNTPTIYNGWEQITKMDRLNGTYNREPITDFMPQMGPMVGYAVTFVIEPSNKTHVGSDPEKKNQAVAALRRYIANWPGPKIAVVQDLDKPNFIGCNWGEVNAKIFKNLGCIGTITDGSIRDLDEMTNVGFKCIASQLCIGHGYNFPIRWDCEVEVFGCKVKPGQLIHADKHGFIAIPFEDEKNLLQGSIFMDNAECDTVTTSSSSAAGKSFEQILLEQEKADREKDKLSIEKFGSKINH